jgi:hypothetical protein
VSNELSRCIPKNFLMKVQTIIFEVGYHSLAAREHH